MKKRIKRWVSISLCLVLTLSCLGIESWFVQAETDANTSETSIRTWSDDFESDTCVDNWTLYKDFYTGNDAESGNKLEKKVSTDSASNYLDTAGGRTEFGADLPKGKVFLIDTNVDRDTFTDAANSNQNVYAQDAVTMVTPKVWDEVGIFQAAQFDLYANIGSDPRNYIVFNYVPATEEAGESWTMLTIRKSSSATRLQVHEYHVTTDLETGMRSYTQKAEKNLTFSTAWTDKTNATNWVNVKVEYTSTGTATFTFVATKDESTSETLTYTTNTKVDEANRMIALGTSISDSGATDNVVIDNFSMTYEQVWEYMPLLRLTEWNESHLTTLEEAAAAFMNMDEVSQEKIVASKEMQVFMQLVYDESLSDNYNNYRDKWSVLLDKDFDEFSIEDKEQVEMAIAEYNNADDITKMLFYNQRELLANVYGELQLYRAEDDYSPFTYNFEDGLNPFEEVAGDKNAACNIVDDPTKEDNSVLAIKGGNTTFLTKYWPETAQVSSITFDVYMPNQSVWSPLETLISYIDEGNYESLRAYNANATTRRLSYKVVEDYVEATGYSDGNLDLSGWLNYNIRISNTGGVAFTVTDQNKNSHTLNRNFKHGGCVGFKIYNSFDSGTSASYTAYIDNFNVVFSGKGDFDENDVITDISVYYSGNTFLMPDETLVLAGEKLSGTVGDIHVSALKNDLTDVKDANVMPGVAPQTSYDDDGELKGIYANEVAHQYDVENAYALEEKEDILQRSNTTINAVLPADMNEGIYAVKLFAKSEDASDTIIYVNRPDISFITGDEGDIATHGGQMQIIGSNLVPTGVADDVTVKLVGADKKVYMLPVSTVYEDNAYSLIVNIPEETDSLPDGEYEVYVHNGYGDNTTWSAPSVIIIGPSPKDAWPSTQFNVRDYGAKGDGTTNDTAAIVNALNDAAANGGGVVYFPKGVYSVVTTLAIPEKVTLLGDNDVESVIRYQALRWQYGKVPVCLSIISNVEIKNLSIQGTRYSGIVQTYQTGSARFASIEEVNASIKAQGKEALDIELANIYFTNVNMRFETYAGRVTNAGFVGVDGVSKTQMINLIDSDTTRRMALDFRGNTNNLQFNNWSFDADNYSSPTFRIWARQIQMRNCKWADYSLCSTSYGAIIENSDLKGAAFNPSGNGFYMYNNYLHDSQGNNRELLTTDGTAAQDDISIQYIGGDAELMKKYTGVAEIDEHVYLADGVAFKETSYEEYNVIVKNGQGKGQVRVIEDVKNVEIGGKTYSLLYLNKPFTVCPNRRSIVDIYEPRCDMFFIDNTFREGAASGTYGSMINAVWDGNVFQRHEGQYLNTNNGSIWYLTLLRQTHEEAIYMHGEGLGTSGSPADRVNDKDLSASLLATTSMYAGSVSCLSIRSCNYDGYGYMIGTPSKSDGLDGFLMENCTFKNKAYALKVGTESYGAFTAVLFRNNNFETDEIYGGTMCVAGDVTIAEAMVRSTTKNRQGYKRFMLIDTRYDSVTIVLGDVNLDGSVTLKDVTVLRFYLAGKVQMDDEQKVRADANGDGSISLKDVTTIRRRILGYVDKEWIGGDY